MSGWTYIAAALIGAAATFLLLPAGALLGNGGLWVSPHGDLAQTLTGHLAFQADAWRWPLLRAANLMWPHGLSIAMTDSNPLVSLLAKLLAGLRGRPTNLLGLWLGACLVLQPVAAVYALRGTGCRSWEAAVAAAVLAICCPALLFRFELGHVNLCGHFVLLFALGMASRKTAAGHGAVWRDWVGPCALLTIAVLVHPYLFVFAGVLLAAPAIEPLLAHRPGWERFVLWYSVALALPVLVFLMLSGTLGSGEKGFGFYSMNLLSPVWPQRSGLFGPGLPILDATGGQYEGYNYLGSGLLLLIGLALVVLVRTEPGPLPPAPSRKGRGGFILVLLGLGALAVSTRVFAGKVLLVSLGTRPWDQIFGMVHASGRAFWAVGYALMISALAVLARHLSRPVLVGVLILAVGLQFADTAPLRADVRSVFAGRDESAPAFEMPAGATLLTILPVCPGLGASADAATTLRLAGVRAGLRLSDITAARLPNWFSCERSLADGLELPMRPREVRVFQEPSVIARLRTAALGREADCRVVAGLVACTRDLPFIAGTPAPPGPALPVVTVPNRFSGSAVAPLLSFGWRFDGDGVGWSEGGRATLLFRLAGPDTETAMTIHLQLEGVARDRGGQCPIGVRLGAAGTFITVLPDLRPARVDVAVPAHFDPDGIVRISLDIDRTVDPARRGLQVPVHRAGVRLLSVQVSRADGRRQ
jgi:Family of unknown function (DUF6311)